MYKAGIKTVCDLAALTPEDLVKAIKTINLSQAKNVIKAAKHSVTEKIDTIKGKMYEMLEVTKAKKP